MEEGSSSMQKRLKKEDEPNGEVVIHGRDEATMIEGR